MAFQTAAGATLRISLTLPATYDQAGYEALTFTTIGEITNIGSFGREYALITHNPLSTRGTKKAKGSWNNQNLSPEMALDNADAGQILVNTALDQDNSVAFELELNNGDIEYFSGIVMSFLTNISGVDDIITASGNIELDDSPIISVAA